MFPNKPWSVSIFEEKRPHIVSFCRNEIVPLLEDEYCRRIVIRAPVKSGKREICEYLAMRDFSTHNIRVHAFISAWHRTADDSQREELKKHNMEVFSITTNDNVEKFKKWVNTRNEEIVIHLDECDHGSGSNQMLSKIWRYIKSSQKQIKIILYSATPEEVLFSGEIDDVEYSEIIDDVNDKGVFCEYNPPEGYCGPLNFLNENLVQEATPFFRNIKGVWGLTDQAKKIIKDMLENMKVEHKRNIIVLRLTYYESKASKESKALVNFISNISKFKELEDFLIFVDKDDNNIKSDVVISEKIRWSDKNYWRSKTTDYPMLFIMDQTSSRSTEWSCHDRVFATHDYRKKIIFSAVSQAQERVNHYEQKYGVFQPIRVYGHIKTFKLSAGLINYDEYLTPNLWSKKKKENKYIIVKNNDVHEIYNDKYSEEEANYILQDIGSYAEVTISSRIKGNIKENTIYDSEFLPCNKNTFKQIQEELINPIFEVEFKNPFLESLKKGLEDNKYKGFLRTWRVIDYERDIKNKDVGWGVSSERPRITICYNKDILGIAIRFDTGNTEVVNTLKTYRSMYS